MLSVNIVIGRGMASMTNYKKKCPDCGAKMVWCKDCHKPVCSTLMPKPTDLPYMNREQHRT